jgi:hypothetical protein
MKGRCTVAFTGTPMSLPSCITALWSNEKLSET